jgi:hypothetical protein
MGAAAFGAVLVDGGAEKVFEPRLPMLPPRRASASFGIDATSTAVPSATTPSRVIHRLKFDN